MNDVDDEINDVDDEIKEYRLLYRIHWRDRSDWYWFYRLVQEVCELFGALLSVHGHSPEMEIKQIAGICVNWYEKRKSEHRKELDPRLLSITILTMLTLTIVASLVISLVIGGRLGGLKP